MSTQAQFNGDLRSVSAPSSISLGQSLTVVITVENTGFMDWETGAEFEYSWMAELESLSWSGINYFGGSYNTVYAGDTATMSLTLTPGMLPAAGGSYSFSVSASLNYIDLGYIELNNSPRTVSFTVISPNNAPTITPIPDKFVFETNLLSFTVSATDTDTPPQTLTFALEPGAPSGASINASNALFTWTPPAGSAPGTNQIAVRVTDNGSPPMSATNTFKVIVMTPLRFLPVARPSNGLVRLAWDSLAGRTYRVRYSDSLTNAWSNLGGDIIATGATTAITNNISSPPARFYQLMLLN